MGTEASAAADSGVIRPLDSTGLCFVGGGRLARLLGVLTGPEVRAAPTDGAQAYMLSRWARAMIVGSGVCIVNRDAPLYRTGVDTCDMAEPGRLPASLALTDKRGISDSRRRVLSSPALPCADGGR